MKATKALLGGGCFWCLDAVYREVKGVISVTSGYAGGLRPNPSYEQICTGATGHAEVVLVEFNEDEIAYEQILEVFFAIHDPTTLNRQGHDVGTQYRSVIFYENDEQEIIAQRFVNALEQSGTFANPIVTEIASAPAFYPAEDYHQNFFANNPGQGYCQMVVGPKVAKFRQYLSQYRR